MISSSLIQETLCIAVRTALVTPSTTTATAVICCSIYLASGERSFSGRQSDSRHELTTIARVYLSNTRPNRNQRRRLSLFESTTIRQCFMTGRDDCASRTTKYKYKRTCGGSLK